MVWTSWLARVAGFGGASGAPADPPAGAPPHPATAMVVRSADAEKGFAQGLEIVDAVVGEVARTTPAGHVAEGGASKRRRTLVTAAPDPRFGVVGPSRAWDGIATWDELPAARAQPAGAPDAPSRAMVVAEVAEPCAWWVPAGVSKAELLAAYEWELAQAFKRPLVQPYGFQLGADLNQLPKFVFSRNYADVLPIAELDEAGRRFRPLPQQMLDVLGAVLYPLPHQVVPSILRFAGITPAEGWMGLPELRELLAPLCLPPPEPCAEGKLRIALPKHSTWRPRGGAGDLIPKTIDRWRLNALATAWWMDVLPASGVLPQMGSRLVFAILLAETRLSQREAERILGHASVDGSQPHALELMVRVRKGTQQGQAAPQAGSRTRALCTITLPHDAPVSALAEALASPAFTAAFQAVGSSSKGARAAPAAQGAGAGGCTGSAGCTWTSLSVSDKSPFFAARDKARHLAELVLSDDDRQRALRSLFDALQPSLASGTFSVVEVLADLQTCRGARPPGAAPTKPQVLGGLAALVSQRVHLALRPQAPGQRDALTVLSCAPAAANTLRLGIRRDCALADLLLRVEERLPRMRAYLRQGSNRRCLAVKLSSDQADEADLFVLRRVPMPTKKRAQGASPSAPVLTPVHSVPQYTFV